MSIARSTLIRQSYGMGCLIKPLRRSALACPLLRRSAPRLALPCFASALPCAALPCFASALLSVALPLPCSALRCITMLCLCPALLCPALPLLCLASLCLCPALLCPALLSVTLPLLCPTSRYLATATPSRTSSCLDSHSQCCTKLHPACPSPHKTTPFSSLLKYCFTLPCKTPDTKWRYYASARVALPLPRYKP
jgi:hypothetical protein